MIDYCGGTTPRITSGSGLTSSRTGNSGERVGAIDKRCPQSHPISPNRTERGLTGHRQHRAHGEGCNINDAPTSLSTEHIRHPSQVQHTNTTTASGRSHIH